MTNKERKEDVETSTGRTRSSCEGSPLWSAARRLQVSYHTFPPSFCAATGSLIFPNARPSVAVLHSTSVSASCNTPSVTFSLLSHVPSTSGGCTLHSLHEHDCPLKKYVVQYTLLHRPQRTNNKVLTPHQKDVDRIMVHDNLLV